MSTVDLPPQSIEAILREVRTLRAEFAELRAILAPLACRQLSRAAQAKKAGVSRSTIYRREKRAGAKLTLMLPTSNHGHR